MCMCVFSSFLSAHAGLIGTERNQTFIHAVIHGLGRLDASSGIHAPWLTLTAGTLLLSVCFSLFLFIYLFHTPKSLIHEECLTDVNACIG